MRFLLFTLLCLLPALGPLRAEEPAGDDARTESGDPKRFLSADEAKYPVRSEAEAKQFVAERLAELKAKIPGDEWRLLESPHFYCFSNLRADLHQRLIQENEALYKKLSEIMGHHEDQPLWNNKCYIYYVNSRKGFIRFTDQVDNSGSGLSGGYFKPRGRDATIGIPIEDSAKNEEERLRMALNAVRHEGTHAFLQLTGKNVPLSQWLHEGMAQFIEFWFDDKKDSQISPRHNVIAALERAVARDEYLSWDEMKRRPLGGADIKGYAFAWAFITFLYKYDPNDARKVPKMIHLIKNGMTDEEAIQTIYGPDMDKMQTQFRAWLKEAVRTKFKDL